MSGLRYGVERAGWKKKKTKKEVARRGSRTPSLAVYLRCCCTVKAARSDQLSYPGFLLKCRWQLTLYVG